VTSLAHRWPPRALTRRYLVLGVLYWIGVRVAIVGAAGMNGTPPPEPSPIDVLPLAVGAAALALVEGKRRGDFHVLGNLGVGRRPVLALWVAPVLLLELLLLALMAMRG
jgi:hypothetical protein